MNKLLTRLPLLALLLASPALAGGSPPPPSSAYVLRSELPSPGAVVPPGVDVNGSVGSGTQYALANHTHATSVQRTRIAITPAGQPVTWTFVKPYDAGVVPIVVCTPELPVGSSLPYVVNISGQPTNTGVSLVVFKTQTQTLGSTLTMLAGTVINLFGPAGPGTTVNCQAAKPTQ